MRKFVTAGTFHPGPQMDYARALKLFAQDFVRRRLEEVTKSLGRAHGAGAIVGRELRMAAINAKKIAEGKNNSISRETEKRLAELLFNGDEIRLREAVVAFAAQKPAAPEAYDTSLMAAVGILSVRDSANAPVYAEAARSISFSGGVRYPTVEAAVEGLEEIVRAGSKGKGSK